MPRTKIVCTMGPGCAREDILREMIFAGMTVARFNFSHGNQEDHLQMMSMVKGVAEKCGLPVALLLDTKGPELRLGPVKGGAVALESGDTLTFTADKVEGDLNSISVNYPAMFALLKGGETILVDDGLIELKVKEVLPGAALCLVINGGEVKSGKGLNIPGINLGLPVLTKQDREDIIFGLDHGIDFIAVSFVHDAGDVLEVRKLAEARSRHVGIVAKIENRAAVENIEEIIKVSDGVMVARGDLGVEIPPEEVPLVQKMIIQLCNKTGKVVITATQMLESMINFPRPTRAEASDVANAIIDGTDAVMLSAETAIGKYPVETVKMMARIAKKTEESFPYDDILELRGREVQATITEAISFAGASIARELGAAAIMTPTTSGSTPLMVARFRPRAPIIAVSPSETTLRRLCLVWGVTPLGMPAVDGTDELIARAVDRALGQGLFNSGDLVVITAGVPAGIPGTTNLIEVHVVGEVLARGKGIGSNVVQGTAKIIRDIQGAEALQEGEIMVVNSTERDFVPYMRRAAAVIAQDGGLTSHAAVVGLSLGVPVIVGASGALSRIRDGERITLDVPRGEVYRGISQAR